MGILFAVHIYRRQSWIPQQSPAPRISQQNPAKTDVRQKGLLLRQNRFCFKSRNGTYTALLYEQIAKQSPDYNPAKTGVIPFPEEVNLCFLDAAWLSRFVVRASPFCQLQQVKSRKITGYVFPSKSNKFESKNKQHQPRCSLPDGGGG